MQKIKNYASRLPDGRASRKKTTRYKEQNPEKVVEYEAKIKEVPHNKRVYVYEAGFDSYLLREYARAPKGQKIYEKIKGRKYQRTSIVAAQCGRRIIAPLEYKGTMHGDFFEAWFENHLLPELYEEDVIILDNASFYRKKRLYEIAERHNVKIIRPVH